MRSRTVTAILTAIGMVALVAGLRHAAHAQQDVAPAPRVFGGGMAFGGPAQLAVSGSHLFVLRGNTVYRLNVSSLAVETQAELPGPQPANVGPTAVPAPPPSAPGTEAPAPTPPAPEPPAPPAPGNGTPPSSP